jgi:hypothetical protein
MGVCQVQDLASKAGRSGVGKVEYNQWAERSYAQ